MLSKDIYREQWHTIKKLMKEKTIFLQFYFATIFMEIQIVISVIQK